MKFKFEITDNVYKIIGLMCCNVIEIILLAYYASFDLDFSINTDYENDFKAFKGLSVTGSLFMMITWFIQIILIYKFNQKILYSILAINSFSIFILLIGMGMGAQGLNKINYPKDSFNFPVALWFIHLCLYIMSLVNLHNYRQNEQNKKKEETNKKKDETDDSKKQLQNTTTQANQSQMVMVGNNESQFTQQQQIV
ncbi:unnamed protein product [Paramecium pentaurelia]|uniref:Transmembrane protein n=1 Tax=Paramecium pentaurelia TaxID=43138 RepID=A0A8S1VK19_9CILI|nr:unnamed protein product [Paramecium pentaurelia]